MVANQSSISFQKLIGISLHINVPGRSLVPEIELYEVIEHLRLYELVKHKTKIGESYLEGLTVLQRYLVPVPINVYKTYCLHSSLHDRMDILDGPVTSVPLGSVVEENRAKFLS
jgi:hypothetical protein